MDKILPLTFQKIHNWSHITFMQHVEAMMTSQNMVSHGFEKLIEDLKLAIEAENASLRVRRKSYITDELVKLNKQREELYAGMLYHYESCLRHYDEALRKAAKGISHIMKSIAYIHNTSSLSRYIYINKITFNIRKPRYAAIVEILQLQGWLDALDALNENYQTMYYQRSGEKTNQGSGNVRAQREVTDKVYQNIVKRVHALIIIDGPEDYTHFVRLLNVYIAHEKQSIAIREGWRRHKKEKKAEEEKLELEKLEKNVDIAPLEV